MSATGDAIIRAMEMVLESYDLTPAEERAIIVHLLMLRAVKRK